MSYIGNHSSTPKFFGAEPTNIDLEGGTYGEDRMYLTSTATLTGDVTVTNDLVFSKLGEDGTAITLTADSTTRTITGSGSISAGPIVSEPGSTLTGMTGTLGTGVFPAGHVLRVFHQTSTGAITVTSGTTIVTGVTQTLTPLSNTSKFLISYNCNGRFNSGADTTFQTQVYYGGSAIGGIGNANNYSNDTNNPSSLNGSFLHTPGTASAITYDVRLALTHGSGSFGLDSGHSHMTIMEIQG